MTTTVSARPVRTQTGEPRWYRPLIIWRVLTAALIAVALVGATIRRGLVLDGPIRWSLMAALALALVGAGLATRWTLQRVHAGRLAGFIIDFLLAVVLGFVAINRMGLFTGLDAVGEAFNGSVAWIGIVILGWLVSGFADKAGTSQRNLKLIARWTMITGLAVLSLSMGLLPGLVEFAQRIVKGNVLPVAILAVASGAFARILWTDAAAALFGTTQTENETMDGLLFVAPNMLGFLTFFAGHSSYRSSSASPSGTG